MIPLTKYRCRNGYKSIIGPMAMYNVAALIVSTTKLLSSSSTDRSSRLDAWCSIRMRRNISCSTSCSRFGVYSRASNHESQCITADHSAMVATTGIDTGTMMRSSTV